MPVPGTDTAPSAAAAQIRVLRGLDPARRLALAVEMSLAARELLAARLQTEHRDWSDAQIRRASLRLTLPESGLPTPLE